MSIREQITQIAQSDPKFAQAVDAMERAVVNMPIMPDDLDEGIETLEKIVKDPSKYAQIRLKAIADDMVDEEMLPEQYDQVYIVSLLVALYGLQDRLSQKGYARGGLTVAARQLAAQGRGGDTELAHVNPREAAMLRRAGGSGTINPNTGLREYKSFLKKIKWGKVLAAVAPIALSFIPGIGTAIGGFLSAGLLEGAAASALGGAAIGAASSAAGGENPLTGAITGGIGGGLGDVLGGAVNSGLNLGLSEGTANILGGGLAGAGASAVQGKDPLTGAVTGAIGAGISGLGGLGIENPDINRAVAGATRGFGNALTAGKSPTEALTAGGLSGLGAAVSPLLPTGSQIIESISGQPAAAPAGEAAPSGQPAATPAAEPASGLSGLATGLLQAEGTDQTSSAKAAQPEATVAPPPAAATNGPLSQITSYDFGGEGNQQIAAMPVSETNRAQPENTTAPPSQFGFGSDFYNNIYPAGPYDAQGYPLSETLPPEPPSTSGSVLGSLAPVLAGGAALAMLGNKSSAAKAPAPVQAAIKNLPLSQQQYLNRPSITWDWDKISADAARSNLSLDQFVARNWNRVTAGEYNVARPMAQGGLNAMSRFVQGGGTGRSDEINAKLSDGEYVIDAETVAMLGDGSSKAGAKRLDEMRASIRRHKGKDLSRGKFSPNAKSPLSYLKEIS
jgi:hypothetical protein